MVRIESGDGRTLSRGPEREDGAKAVYRQNPEIKDIVISCERANRLINR